MVFRAHDWSGRRESNPRPPRWRRGALPLSYARIISRLSAGTSDKGLERAEGVEPSASTMATWRSAAELRPHQSSAGGTSGMGACARPGGLMGGALRLELATSASRPGRTPPPRGLLPRWSIRQGRCAFVMVAARMATFSRGVNRPRSLTTRWRRAPPGSPPTRRRWGGVGDALPSPCGSRCVGASRTLWQPKRRT